jgi:hypothetical protein
MILPDRLSQAQANETLAALSKAPALASKWMAGPLSMSASTALSSTMAIFNCDYMNEGRGVVETMPLSRKPIMLFSILPVTADKGC